MRAAIAILVLVVLVAGCGDDGEGGRPSPTPAATATPAPPNQFGFTDDLLRVGAARASMAPLRAGSPEAAAAPGVATFETYTEFDFTIVCPSDPELQLTLQADASFDGALTRPQGDEPFVDCGGTAGTFDPGIDAFRDLNGNGQFDGNPRNPAGLEPFDDANGNGRFDAIWLGGFDSGRAVLGVDADSPPAVTATVISKGREFGILVTLDTIGNVSTHLNPLRQRIATELGLDGSAYDSPDVRRIVVSSLHNHEAADTIGIAGPTALNSQAVLDALHAGLLTDLGPFAGVPVRTGINFEYRDWTDDQVIAAVRAAVRDLRPAELRIAAAPAPMRTDEEVLNPAPADQTQAFRIPRRDQVLMTDIRFPFVRDPLVLAFQARDSHSGETIVTLANWTNHVEVLGSRNTLLSADYAGHVRQHLESRFGGIGVFAIGTVGGLQTPLGDVFVPVTDASANVATTGGASVRFADLYAPVLDGRESASTLAATLFTTTRRAPDESFEKTASLGRLVGEIAALGLQRGEFRQPGRFEVRARTVLVPLENPTLYLGAVLGVVEGREALFAGVPSTALITDRSEQCGLVGCIRETITLMDFGDYRFVTAPGELLPEYTLGRPRPGIAQDERLHFVRKDGAGNVVHDFGVNEFSRIHGLRGLHEGEPLFVFGLAQGQLGYFIPRSDWVNVFEAFLPRPEDIDAEVGPLADLNVAPLLGLQENPGFGAEEPLSIRQIVNAAWAKFPPERYPQTRLGGVSLVDVPGVDIADDHPNTIGNNNSIGPRAGHVVYNAMCDLVDDSAGNDSCPSKLEVQADPNG